MKRKNVSTKAITLLGVVIAFTASLLFYSCKKNAADGAYLSNAMQMAARALDGQTLVGSIKSESTGNELALDYNNGSKFIVIDRLPETGPITVNSITSAEVVISDYGLVIKDITRNQVWLLVNNDPESLKKFERIKAVFGNASWSATVFGTTIINPDRS